ncbi:hypothetical protein L0F63_001594 [Massospora cicadina]|nr:hypothetical protein L0F63_001594 [Massospora cicadina]
MTKTFSGGLRPDWIARCRPLTGKAMGAILTIDDCTYLDKELVLSGQKSFMSGHAGASFAGFFFLCLFLAGQFSILHKGRLFNVALVMVPLSFPVWVSLSRIADHRHHPHDVIAGGITGIVAATISYFLYFPSLNSDFPYIPMPLAE